MYVASTWLETYIELQV